MKKALVFVLMVMLFIPVAAVYADDAIGVTIDGEVVAFGAQAPVIVDGRTLVPVRGVFEQLGFVVDWDGDLRQASLTSDDYIVLITIDSTTFTTNGANHTLDVPAQIIGGSTMLPIRAVLESVGYYLDWDANTRTVLIMSEQSQDAATAQDAPATDSPGYVTMGGVQFFDGITHFNLMAVLEYWIDEFGFDEALEFLDEFLTQGLYGLRYFPNLTSLSLAGVGRSMDITPLSALTGLTYLYMEFNDHHITDITPLASLTNLTRLNLSGNDISDITPLAGLVNLTRLHLSMTLIEDISPLAGLVNLEFLSLLQVDGITDWSPVDHVENVSGRP